MSPTIAQTELACTSAVRLVDDLQQALKHAGAVEALVILPLIERAAALRNDVNALRLAVKHSK